MKAVVYGQSPVWYHNVANTTTGTGTNGIHSRNW